MQILIFASSIPKSLGRALSEGSGYRNQITSSITGVIDDVQCEFIHSPHTSSWATQFFTCETDGVGLLSAIFSLSLGLQILMLGMVVIIWGLFVYFAYYKYVGYCHRHKCSILASLRDNLRQNDPGMICSICRLSTCENGFRYIRPTLCCRQGFCYKCWEAYGQAHDLVAPPCPVCRGRAAGMYGNDDIWYLSWRDAMIEAVRNYVLQNLNLFDGDAPIGVVQAEVVDEHEPALIVDVVNNEAVILDAVDDDPPSDDEDSDEDSDSDDNSDDEDADEHPGPVYRTEDDEPDTEIVDNNSNRRLHVEMKSYRFPDLQFFGLWNNSNTSDVGRFYNSHFGWFFHTGKYLTVELPSTLIDELGVFWAGRQRTVADLLAGIAVSKVWLRGVTGLTAHQLNNAAQYAASIAMHKTDLLRQNVMRVVFSDFCTHRMFIAFLSLCLLVLSWLPWRFFLDLTRYFVTPQPLPKTTNFMDIWNIYERMNVRLLNVVAEYTSFTAPVVDCTYWKLPRLWVYECLDTYENYYQISIICWLVMVVVFLCVVTYVSCKKPWVVGFALFEDVIRFALALWFSQYHFLWGVVPSIILGLVEVACVRKPIHLLFHTAIGFGFWFPLPCVVVHILSNWFFPDHAFNVIKCIRYALSNIVVPAVQYRAHGVMEEPPFYEAAGVAWSKRGRDFCPQSQCLYGIGSSGYRPVAYAPNYINEKSAVEARILAETPEPDENATNDCIQWVRRNILKLFPKLFCVASVDFETYLKNSNASASVKRTLKRTMERLRLEGIDEDSILSPEELHRWTKRKAFVKVENNVYRTPAGRKKKASRLIQGAAPEFVCLVGPWMMAFQSVIKKQWNAKNFICFTSGVSNVLAAKLVDQPGWEILEDDIGAFDASVNRPWLNLELWIFKKFGCPRATLDLIRANVDTHGVTSKGIRYKRQGMRKSGDPYTSVGNSLLNGLMHVYIYCRSTGKTVGEARNSLRMLVQGDDNLMRYVSGPVINWVESMLEFGFTSEAVFRETLYEAEFCSNLFYETDVGPVLAPKPGKVMAKLGYYINPPANVEPAALVRGTALGLYNACHHIPPLRAYLDRLLELTDGIVPHKTPIDEWKMRYTLANEVPETWCTLEMRYGWTGACQAEFEKGLKSAFLGQECDHVLLHLLCDRDTSGPQTMYIGA